MNEPKKLHFKGVRVEILYFVQNDSTKTKCYLEMPCYTQYDEIKKFLVEADTLSLIVTTLSLKGIYRMW